MRAPRTLAALIGGALALAWLAGACSGDDATPADDDGSSAVSSGSGGGAPAQLASGVHIDGVELNQGVGIRLVQDGNLLPATALAAPIIAGRPGLLRVFWQLDADFAPRPIEARLALSYPDGTSTSLSDPLVLSGAPDPSQVGGTFSFSLDAEDLRAGASWQLSLHEVDGGGPASGPAQPPRIPATSPQPLGLWAQPMQLDVVIVPATLNCTPNGPLTINEQVQSDIAGQIYNLYPLATLNLQFHDPVVFQVSNCNDSAAVLAEVSALRESEALGPAYYYHAIFSHEDQDWFDDGGYSWLLEDTSMGADRVSYSVNFWPDEPNNVTHELGHNHGREHTFNDAAYQPSAEAGPSCGRRESWGYGLVPWQHPQHKRVLFPQLGNVEGWLVPPTDQLSFDSRANVCLGHMDPSKGPAFNDFMSYASPYWVSAYTYAAIAERISAISAWAQADQAGPGWQQRQSLHGYFLKDGRTRWQLARGVAAAEQNTVLDASNRAVLSLPAHGSAKQPPTEAQLPIVLKQSGEGAVGGVAVVLPAEFTVPQTGSFEVTVAGVQQRARWSQVRRAAATPLAPQ